MIKKRINIQTLGVANIATLFIWGCNLFLLNAYIDSRQALKMLF